MGWPSISLSLLNSFFLNRHFVVEQMNPRCEKNSSHSQWMKSRLIKGKILFLPGSEYQDSISWSWEGIGNLNKSHKDNFLVTRKVITRAYLLMSYPVRSASSETGPLPPLVSPELRLLLRPSVGIASYLVLKGQLRKTSSRTSIFTEGWTERE